MEIAFGIAVSQYPAGTFQTTTAGRVTLAWKPLLQMYFADPYFPGNGARKRIPMVPSIARVFTKETDSAQNTDEALETALRLIN